MKGINKVVLLGSVYDEIEIRQTQTGLIVNILLETKESYKGKFDEQPKEHIEYHRVAFYGRHAQTASQQLKKGTYLYIDGCLKTRKWTDKSGTGHASLDIMAKDLIILELQQSIERSGNVRDPEEIFDED